MSFRSAASLAYRRAASQHSSPVVSLLALYDTLLGDLRRAVQAMRQDDIEGRSRELKHGFPVLTQLDAMLDTERGGHTAQKLRHFYGHLRREMLRAQFERDPEVLEQAAKHLLDVREAWVQVQAREESRAAAAEAPNVELGGEPISLEA
jgi:flagellar secretion chaperone FliS